MEKLYVETKDNDENHIISKSDVLYTMSTTHTAYNEIKMYWQKGINSKR